MHLRHKKLELTVRRTLADGPFTEDERASIRRLGEELGVSEEYAAHTLEIALHALERRALTCPHCGNPVHVQA